MPCIALRAIGTLASFRSGGGWVWVAEIKLLVVMGRIEGQACSVLLMSSKLTLSEAD